MLNYVGDTVAENAAQLWSGTLTNAVDFDEFGQGGPAVAWTGSKVDGTPGLTCSDWTSNLMGEDGTQGDANAVDAGWIAGPDDRCSKVKALYCVSQ